MSVAECAGIAGYVSLGEPSEKTIKNFCYATAACLEARAERAMPLNTQTQEVEVFETLAERSTATAAAMYQRSTATILRQPAATRPNY